jgi:hypothetical protein
MGLFIILKKNTMSYIILKQTNLMGKNMTILVNDSEGVPMEFETAEQAQKVADLFQSNTTIGSVYTVKTVS